jgi:hypothetical protein
MTILLVVPLLVAIAGAAVLGILVHRVRPHFGAGLCSLSILSVITAGWITAWFVWLGYLAHLPGAGDRLIWCREALGVHSPPSAAVGLAGFAVAAWATARVLVVTRRWRAERGIEAGRVRVLDSARAFAFAEPGARGGIVVSSSMIAALEPDERQALLAHEQAHLRNRHDLFLILAVLVDHVPLLSHLGRQLRLALERWADEDAARYLGDRRLVARAVARAALAAAPNQVGFLSATGGNVPARVLALTAPKPFPFAWSAAGAALGGASLVGAVWQLHHLLAALEIVGRH